MGASVIRKCLKRFFVGAFWLTLAGLPAHAWNDTELARVKATFGDTIVIVPVDAASNQSLTHTDATPEGPLVRNVVCLDTVACKDVAAMAGMSETLRGTPFSLASILELGTPDQFIFYSSSPNAAFANTPQNQPSVFFVAYPNGQALSEAHGGISYTMFYTDLKHAEEMQNLAATYVGPVEVSAMPLAAFIGLVISGEIANAVLTSPYRNAWWLTKWQTDNTAAIATAVD